MAVRVSAAQAATLVNRNERQIREAIKRGRLRAEPAGPNQARANAGPSRWAIDVEALAAVPGWVLDHERLALLQLTEEKGPGGVLARLEVIERDMAILRRRLTQLEQEQEAHTKPLRVSESQGEPMLALNGTYPLRAASAPSAEPLSQFQPSANGWHAPASSAALARPEPEEHPTGSFRTHSDAARWLMLHGIASPGTPKSWPGWRECELTPEAILTFALSLQDPHNHRITWRLHPCETSGCICHRVLVGR